MYSACSPASSVAPRTRASVRIGRASLSLAKPLANVTNRPDRSDFGNGLAPQDGWPPCRVGSIQIEHEALQTAKRGQHVAVKIAEIVRRGDRVFLVTRRGGKRMDEMDKTKLSTVLTTNLSFKPEA